jgi:class 3 adenylate cyclase/tetratricopeptide (TPR) repeat protein
LVLCPTCEAENRDDARFCRVCGARLALACPSCGAAREPGQEFCDQCGIALAPPAAGDPAPELRVASVLFVDLVGYTSLSESRDAEDVRDLLSRYFEQARAIVDRYGGAIDKFIGDAVMAVWGVPVARGDDAERAVRAGLELLDAVAAFGERFDARELRARAGVATGQVAALANPGEGLVVGDRVNIASRAQATAEPGSLLVDETTRQVAAAAISFEDAGEHAVKGKAEPLRLFRALRVVAGIAGSQRTSALEAPFVGRASELRLVKDLFHASVDRGVARLVGISGPAGIGKTRLGSELSNYVDGLAYDVLWHSGRCLSFGDGVAYWALAEMVRQRLGVAEDASEDEAASRLTEGLDRWIADPDERRRLRSALGALIGIAEPGLERAELFASWRLFLERLSEHHPVALLFEDMQWADEELLDFVEGLLKWSAEHPIFICTFARPELAERRPGWPAGVANATSLVLAPLGPDAVTELLEGLVTLPVPALRRIVAQAEGMPLYAVETVRALADRGVLVQRDERLEPAAEIGELDVPASLHSLLSARIDALSPPERELVKAMAVFGSRFPRASAAALAELPEDRLDDVLASLVGREILSIRTDPLSPERGQYAFAQGMLRTVAYEMIGKRERKPRHLAAAEYLRTAFPNQGEEVAEVIAAHLLGAYRAAAGDPDEAVLRERASAALRLAAQRAATVGGLDAAERALRTAIELADDDQQRTELREEAGQTALNAGRFEAALELFEGAAAGHAAAGRDRSAARLAGPIGYLRGRLGHDEEAIAAMREALELLGDDRLDPDVAAINCEIGRALLFTGRPDEAGAAIERALAAAEALELPELTCRAMDRKAIHLEYQGRFEEALALHEGAVAIGERHRVPRRHLALGNAAVLRLTQDLAGANEACEAALAAARRAGDRAGESIAICNLMTAKLVSGEWDEVAALGERTLAEEPDRPDFEYIEQQLGLLRVYRGELEAARSNLDRMAALEGSDDVEARHCLATLDGLLASAEGDRERGLELLERTAREGFASQGASSESARIAWPEAVGAALTLGRVDAARDLVVLLAERPRGLVAPLLRAELERARALLATLDGDDTLAERSFATALDDFARLGYPFWRARALNDLAGALIEHGRGDEAAAVLEPAAEALAALGARPELDRSRDLLERARGSAAGQPAADSR